MGFGSFASVNLLPTIGYGIGAAPPSPTIGGRRFAGDGRGDAAYADTGLGLGGYTDTGRGGSGYTDTGDDGRPPT